MLLADIYLAIPAKGDFDLDLIVFLLADKLLPIEPVLQEVNQMEKVLLVSLACAVLQERENPWRLHVLGGFALIQREGKRASLGLLGNINGRTQSLSNRVVDRGQNLPSFEELSRLLEYDGEKERLKFLVPILGLKNELYYLLRELVESKDL